MIVAVVPASPFDSISFPGDIYILSPSTDEDKKKRGSGMTILGGTAMAPQRSATSVDLPARVRYPSNLRCRHSKAWASRLAAPLRALADRESAHDESSMHIIRKQELGTGEVLFAFGLDEQVEQAVRIDEELTDFQVPPVATNPMDGPEMPGVAQVEEDGEEEEEEEEEENGEEALDAAKGTFEARR